MDVFDDLNPSGEMASGIRVLVNDIYHLLITQRGSMRWAPDFGLSLTDQVLKAIDPTKAAALPSTIEAAIEDDERVKSCEVAIMLRDGEPELFVVVQAASSPPATFELVGSLSAMKARLLEGAADG